MVLTRELQIHEIDRIEEIQRQEEIHSHYKLKDGTLTVVEYTDHVNAFDKGELIDILYRQKKIKNEGGHVIGAFDGGKIVGVVSVESKRRGFEFNYCKMDILYVSYGYRQLGIGRKLVDLGKKAAKNFGASKLYISATPTTNTVNFYLKLGAVLTTELDLELYQKEPDDIHLELKVDV